MKYIDAELLEAELKRRIKERDNMMKLGTYFSTSYVYEDILDLIDSLQQEQQEVDLEKAAEEYRRESYRKSVLPNIDGPTSEYDGNVKTAFIAGAQWMENQFKHCGTFPIEDSRGGYWPTDYYIKKK